MTLSVVRINDTADQIERPFDLVPVAKVGELAVSLYVCQGEVGWHKHVDEDELFLVHEGVVALDTQLGRLTLHSEEVAVVPKGTFHRSSSQLRSVVLLVRPVMLTDRKNGHRRHAVDTDPPLEKERLARVANTIPEPYRPVVTARVEGCDLLLFNANGRGPAWTAPRHGALYHVVRGCLDLEFTDGSQARLEAGELTVIPGGLEVRLGTDQPSLVLSLAHGD